MSVVVSVMVVVVVPGVWNSIDWKYGKYNMSVMLTCTSYCEGGWGAGVRKKGCRRVAAGDAPQPYPLSPTHSVPPHCHPIYH